MKYRQINLGYNIQDVMKGNSGFKLLYNNQISKYGDKLI